MYVRAGRPAFARPCVGVHKSTSLVSSSLLLQQCPACLFHLTWIVFVIGGRWPSPKINFFLFIGLLSVMIDNAWKPISSKQIIVCLTMSNKLSAWRHLVDDTTCTTSLYCENTQLSIKSKTLVAALLLLLDKPTILPALLIEIRFQVNFFNK